MAREVQVRNILVGAGDLFATEDQTFGAAATDPDFEGTTTSLIETMSNLDDNQATSGWFYVGATQDGVELAYTPDYGEVEVDQLKGAALLFNTAVSVTASTTLAEATLENLLVAWGIAETELEAIADGNRFNIGMPGDDPIERQLVIVGKGNPAEVQEANPDYDATATPLTTNERGDSVDANGNPEYLYFMRPTERAYHARRVISAEGATLALRRTEPTTYGVTFRLLPDPNAAADSDTGTLDSQFGVIVDRLLPADRAA